MKFRECEEEDDLVEQQLLVLCIHRMPTLEHGGYVAQQRSQSCYHEHVLIY